ncbi:dual specificity protein phosphatase 12 [Strongylocentrotus purpuratus]|uniref:protein-tyrosine-phosphatase n=1 Tax=Strongylocentrotus purpuratus TaxID=7668 RepID=A0A7M7PL56_STRPU|nr:dual specificity protein phosphatase 12 [Strongylocentrotus purpuratus]
MPGDADEILPRLWLGDLQAAESERFLNDRKISHVLSLINMPITVPSEVAVNHKQIIIRDQPGEDLLTHLEDILAFMEDGLDPAKEGSVLVHCAMGVSRSSSAVIAYIMYKEKCPLVTALKKVVDKHSQTCPNTGFMEQLKLFEAMGCQCDTTNSQFKQHRLSHLAEEIHSREEIPKDLLASDPAGSSPDPAGDNTLYKCRKCRRALFCQSSVIAHENTKGHRDFGWHKHKGQMSKEQGSISCTSVFVEPVSWMESFLMGVHEGKISCPKCDSRLGSFNWAGAQCSCGFWMTPAFQIHLNRVDHMVPVP